MKELEAQILTILKEEGGDVGVNAEFLQKDLLLRYKKPYSKRQILQSGKVLERIGKVYIVPVVTGGRNILTYRIREEKQ